MPNMYFPYTLKRVRIQPYRSYVRITVNDMSIDAVMDYRKPTDEVVCRITLICRMLQRVCHVRYQGTGIRAPHPGCDPQLLECCRQRHQEFVALSMTVASLHQLCLLTVRRHVTVHSFENFSRLGLPAPLLSLLTLTDLAEELDAMDDAY